MPVFRLLHAAPAPVWSGDAIGEGLIVDFSRHNRQITDLDLEKRTVRVGAGVVLDQLNDFLQTARILFRPRCGDEFARHARRNDREQFLRRALPGLRHNRRSCVVAGNCDGRWPHRKDRPDARIVSARASGRSRISFAREAREMAERWPPGLIKRWPGYGIERFLRAPNDLTNILAGSEGTLAAIFSAELKISPLPREKGLGLIFFASVDEAMQATVELLDLKPAAIEHIDRPLLDQTKGQLHFQAARDLLELDAKPCESILIVEFYDDVAERLVDLAIAKAWVAHENSHRAQRR